MLSSPHAKLRALGLLLADGAPAVGWGKTFWHVGCFFFFFTKTAVSRDNMLSSAHVVLAGSFGALLVGWWLWRTDCISQDTYLLYVDLCGDT